MPRVVAELGPGDSIGVGLAALLSGAEKYFALDVVKHADLNSNLEVFERLVVLFQSSGPIPEIDNVKPGLDDVSFPRDLLNDFGRLDLSDQRLDRIRDSIRNPDSVDSLIKYQVPWANTETVELGSVDLIFSQAVLEHVDDLEVTYKAMFKWLSGGGFMSHQIDFKCHNTFPQWNGHWTADELLWSMIRGRQPYLLNRESASTHRDFIQATGFDVILEEVTNSETLIGVKDLAPRFNNMSVEDIETSGLFVVCKKRT
tara:strand:- start:15940 stop:16710 length:771 start_codon:yes stop_codon:yes gene_type:complete